MSELNLEAIKERAEKATAGPWWVFMNASNKLYVIAANPDVGSVLLNYPEVSIAKIMDDVGREEVSANGLFISHSREDVSALIAEVERLRSENAQLKEDVRFVSDYSRRAVLAGTHPDTPAISEAGDGTSKDGSVTDSSVIVQSDNPVKGEAR